jgi:hypothetical protein
MPMTRKLRKNSTFLTVHIFAQFASLRSFFISRISRGRFALIFLSFRISRVRFASIF